MIWLFLRASLRTEFVSTSEYQEGWKTVQGAEPGLCLPLRARGRADGLRHPAAGRRDPHQDLRHVDQDDGPLRLGDSSAHGGRASVASCMFQEDQTKPDTGDYNTHGCCCCALLRRAESSPVSRQLKIQQPATDTEGGTTGTCGSSPRTP